jgi:uncharacterized protein (TIRG00374 family)
MKKYGRLLVILILSLVMVIALFRLGNLPFSWETVARVNPFWYSLVVVSYYASIVARGWRWQKILRTMGYRVGFVYANALLTTGLFLNAVLPARAGEVGRIAMLKRDYNIPVSKGLASIAGERALDVFAIVAMALVAGWLALPGHLPPTVLNFLLGMGLLLILGLVGLLVIPGLEGWLRNWGLLRKIIRGRLWDFYQKVLDFGFALIEGVRVLGRDPLALAVVVAQSFFVWVWDALMVYFILLSLGIVQPFSMSLFAAMVSDLVTAVPITPGSLGQFDATLISLLTLFGIPTANASLTVLLLRLVQLWTFIPVSGAVTYIFGFARALDIGGPTGETADGETEAHDLSTNPAESQA